MPKRESGIRSIDPSHDLLHWQTNLEAGYLAEKLYIACVIHSITTINPVSIDDS